MLSQLAQNRSVTWILITKQGTYLFDGYHFCNVIPELTVRHFLPRENNSQNYSTIKLLLEGVILSKIFLLSSRRRTEFTLDTRTSLALFGSFSSTDYVASQCIRWSYDFILFFSLILIYTIESKLKRSVADLCQHSHISTGQPNTLEKRFTEPTRVRVTAQSF